MRLNEFLNVIFRGLWNVNWYVVIIFVILIVFLLIAFDSNQRTKYKGIKSFKLPTKPLPQKKTSTSSGEEECRRILQSIFGKEFKSVRPRFLRNPKTGRNLELDCYNSDLRLALEYDGKQHAEYTPFFHRKGPQDFVDQISRDYYKSKMCRENGVTLIRVPHFVPKADLKAYIVDQLRKAKKLPS